MNILNLLFLYCGLATLFCHGSSANFVSNPNSFFNGSNSNPPRLEKLSDGYHLFFDTAAPVLCVVHYKTDDEDAFSTLITMEMTSPAETHDETLPFEEGKSYHVLLTVFLTSGLQDVIQSSLYRATTTPVSLTETTPNGATFLSSINQCPFNLQVTEITQSGVQLDLTELPALPTIHSIAYSNDAGSTFALQRQQGTTAVSNPQLSLSGLRPATTYYAVVACFMDIEANLCCVQPPLRFTTTNDDTSTECRGDNVALLKDGASVVEVSSIWSNGGPDSSFGSNHAIDGNPSSEWSTAADGDDAYIVIRLPTPTAISGFGVYSREMVGSSQIFIFALEFSNSQASNMFKVGAIRDLPDTYQLHRYDAPDSMKGNLYDTIRLDVIASNGFNTGLRLLEIYPDLCCSGPNVALLADGAFVVEVSSIWSNGGPDSSFGSNHAIDGNPSSEWSTAADGNDAHITIRLAKATAISSFGVYSREMVGSSQIFSFQLIFSNSADVSVVDFVTDTLNLPDTDQLHRYDSPTAGTGTLYDTVRLNVITSNGFNTGLRLLEVNSDSCNTVSAAPAVSMFCFAASQQVQVKDRDELVAMENLQLGDLVLVDAESNKYESIYSFGHKNAHVVAEYLEIRTSKASIVLSKDHMLVIVTRKNNRRRFVPASLIQVGDELSGGLVVKSIKTVLEKGAFAPFTPSGRIVVNGAIEASTFVALQEESETLVVAGLSTGISFQWLARTFELPHRTYCHVTMNCKTERYTKDGISTWVALPHKVVLWFMQQHVATTLALLPVVAVIFSFLGLVDFVFWRYPWVGAAVALLFLMTCSSYSARIKKPV